MAAKKPPSLKPLADRLQSKPDTKWYVPSGTPRSVTLDGMRVHARRPQRIDALLVFVKNQESLEVHFAKAEPRLVDDALVWFSYPKGGLSDLTRDEGWGCLEAAGLRPVTAISINETWSALRFRPRPAGAKGRA